MNAVFFYVIFLRAIFYANPECMKRFQFHYDYIYGGYIVYYPRLNSEKAVMLSL